MLNFMSWSPRLIWASRRDTDAWVTFVVGLGALERRVELQRSCDAVEREVALDLEVLIIDRPH